MKFKAGIERKTGNKFNNKQAFCIPERKTGNKFNNKTDSGLAFPGYQINRNSVKKRQNCGLS